MRVMPMSVLGSPGAGAVSRLRERSGENARSEEQDSKFDDSGRHLAEIVSCKNSNADDLSFENRCSKGSAAARARQ
jgi:hypothetical protein